VDELLQFSSHIMVIRDGRNVLELDVPEDEHLRPMLKSQISAAMVGTGVPQETIREVQV